MVNSTSTRPCVALPGHRGWARFLQSAVGLAVPMVLVLAGDVMGQSIVRGDVGGRVTDATGFPLQQAVISAEDQETGIVRWAAAARDGSFRLSSLPSGEYEVRVESLGYRPVVYEGVPIHAGRSVEFRVQLARVTPPVGEVEVVPFRDLAGTRLAVDGGRWFGSPELMGTSEWGSGLPGVASRSAAWDRSGGTQGLPSMLTRTYVDGVPFTPARHPYRPSEDLGLAALPNFAVARLNLIAAPTDAEWTGSGGMMAVGTRSAGGQSAATASALGSHAALWQSQLFEGGEPSTLSYWANALAEIPLSGDSARMSLAAEAGRVSVPRRLSLDPTVVPALVTDPSTSDFQGNWVEEREVYAGFLRLDWTVGAGTEVMARVNAGHARSDGGGFFSPAAEYGFTSSHIETDFSGALSVSTPIGSRLVLEMRAGLEGSRRGFGTSAGGGLGSSIASTHLVSQGLWVGRAPGSDGRVLRKGVFGSSALHLSLGDHRLKAGGDVSVASYEYAVPPDTEGTFFFGDTDDLLARDGAYVGVVGGAVQTAFSAAGAGAFLQYLWNPTPQLSVASGVRADRESLPADRVAQDGRWLDLTGLSTASLPASTSNWGARIAGRWDVTGDGGSVLVGTLASENGSVDPGILHEAVLLDGPVGVRRAVGALGTWPAAPGTGVTGASRPILSIVNPGFRPPRTTRGTVTFSQRLAPGATVRASGTLRSTEFLPRRTDLNRALLPSASSNLGRDLYGELTKVGSVLLATPGSNRRFDEFDRVWAVNSDGTSDHIGLTMAVELSSGTFDLTAEYSFSRTEDDWVGAAMGVPDARLDPALPGANGGDGVQGWGRGTSDFDLPHRLVIDASTALPFLEGIRAGATFRFQSGAPFTPSYGAGADVNGDGSSLNDPAYIPDDSAIAGLLGEWPCLGSWIGQVVGRNSCRAPGVHTLDVRLAAALLAVGDLEVDLLVEGLNLLDARTGLRDTALFRVSPDDPVVVSGTGLVEIPVVVNPGFGDVLHPTGPGRRVRIGLRVTTP